MRQDKNLVSLLGRIKIWSVSNKIKAPYSYGAFFLSSVYDNYYLKFFRNSSLYVGEISTSEPSKSVT